MGDVLCRCFLCEFEYSARKLDICPGRSAFKIFRGVDGYVYCNVLYAFYILYNKTNGGEGSAGLVHTDEHKAKSKATKLKNGTLHNPHKPAARQKAIATMKERGTNQSSPAVIAKQIETKKKNGTLAPTAEAIEKMVATRKKNGSYKNTPEAVAKIQKTKIANGTNKGWKNPPDTGKKAWETRRKNAALRAASLSQSL